MRAARKHLPTCLGLHKLDKEAGLGHEPGNLTHPKRYSRDRTAEKEGPEASKMIDCPANIQYLVAYMVDPVALFEGAVDGGVRPERSHEFQRGISAPAVQEADRDILERIVEWARDKFIAEKLSKNGDCWLELSYRNTKVMKLEIFHAIRSFHKT
jgi:hypothetical protein